MRAVGPYQVNTILAWCEDTKEAVIFDPGAEAETILSDVDRLALLPKLIVNTHGHLDHIAENCIVKQEYEIPLLIGPEDRPMLTDPLKNLSAFTGQPVRSPDADGELREGDKVEFGKIVLEVLHIPGHSPGSLVFYHPGVLIAGDTLFCGGVGRTDFPGSSQTQLFDSIRKKLYTLPEDTVVYPGHGPTTTIGEERISNPFVRA